MSLGIGEVVPDACLELESGSDSGLGKREADECFGGKATEAW